MRDVGRVMGMPFGDVDRLAKLIPRTRGITLEEAYSQSRELRETVEKEDNLRELWDLARSLEGQIRNPGRHAAGIVISPDPLLDLVPLYRDPRTKDVVTQYDWRRVEEVGLIKFDFLGLRTLTIIQHAVDRILEHHDPDFDINQVALDDAKTYELLCSADTDGIFQLSGSTGMADLVYKLQPRHFRDLIPLVALYRPGPLQSGMVDDFINRRHGRTAVEYLLPELEEILAETYGVILYQDQVLQIANTLASFSLGQGDLLRRAMGKKVHAEMEKQRDQFLEGCKENQHPLDKSNQIFDLMYQFAGYGFNKAHSAAYGLITHQTAYLKAHYPAEFYAACMTAEWRESDKLDRYMRDAARRSIEIKGPDINESIAPFNVVEAGKVIRFGLSGVKNVGEGAVEAIVESRDAGGPFRGLFDFCARIDKERVNRRVIESLIRCGSFDFLKATRASLIEALPKAIEAGARQQRDRAVGQASLFGAGESEAEPSLPEVEEWNRVDLLAGEKEMLGFYVTGHPLQDFERAIRFFSQVRLSEIGEEFRGRTVRIGGLLSALSTQRTRKGDLMARAQLEDIGGAISVVIFPRAYDNHGPLLRAGEPVFLLGTLQMETERAELVVDDVIPIEQIWERCAKELRIEIGADQADAERLRGLREVLDLNPGRVPVGLKLDLASQGAAELELSGHSGAVSENLVRRLEAVVEGGQVYCVASP